MYEKILVALDGSEHAKQALNYAIETAAKWDAQLLILTVAPPVSPLAYSSELSAPYARVVNEAVKESYQQVLTEANNIVESRQPGVKAVTLLEEGNPSIKIVEIAQKEDVDLIVMGSRGMGGIVGYLGSTSRHVVEACDKPILIVK